VVRALELAEIGASLAPVDASRLWTDETRRSTLIVGLDVPAQTLNRRIEQRTRQMVDRGVVEEVSRALEGPMSPTARKAIGLEEFASLPLAEAVEATTRRTRQYAAYQRKWLRRIPGVVSVRADRPPHAVADEILEVARARQRLSAPRAG
jgi:tRNA dimethylallyltransferase